MYPFKDDIAEEQRKNERKRLRLRLLGYLCHRAFLVDKFQQVQSEKNADKIFRCDYKLDQIALRLRYL